MEKQVSCHVCGKVNTQRYWSECGIGTVEDYYHCDRTRHKQVDRLPGPQTGDREGAKVRQVPVNDKQLNRLLAKLKF